MDKFNLMQTVKDTGYCIAADSIQKKEIYTGNVIPLAATSVIHRTLLKDRVEAIVTNSKLDGDLKETMKMVANYFARAGTLYLVDSVVGPDGDFTKHLKRELWYSIGIWVGDKYIPF